MILPIKDYIKGVQNGSDYNRQFAGVEIHQKVNWTAEEGDGSQKSLKIGGSRKIDHRQIHDIRPHQS
jgi:hypothetical protein